MKQNFVLLALHLQVPIRNVGTYDLIFLCPPSNIKFAVIYITVYFLIKYVKAIEMTRMLLYELILR